MDKHPLLRFSHRFVYQRIFGQLGDLELLIFEARKLGLAERYIIDALDNIDHHEPQLACECILEQIYEFDINIDTAFYDLAMDTCNVLKIDTAEYQFLRELICDSRSS